MNKFTEVVCDTALERGSNKYMWRLVEINTTDDEQRPQKVSKLVLSRFWFNGQVNRWVPSKDHLFLPAEEWLQVKKSLERVGQRICSAKDGGHTPQLDDCERNIAPKPTERKRRRNDCPTKNGTDPNQATKKRQQVKKTCPKERSKRERSVPVQQQQETHEQVLGHRLKLDAALVHAGKLFDMLVDHDRLRDADEFSVFHKLSLRNIVLEKLTKELNARNVLPVTVMTLSKLFAQAFVAYKA